MNCEKVYYRESFKINIWWWLVVIPIGPILIYLGIFYSFISHLTNTIIVIVGTIFILSLVVFWLNEKKLYFRKYVQIKDDGIMVKTGVISKVKNIHWDNILNVDLNQFEPRIFMKDKKPIIIVMEYEQNMIFRNLLKRLEKENQV